MDIAELTKWVVNRGDDLCSISTQVDFKRKLDKYYAEQLRLCGVVKSLKGKKAMSFGVWKMKCKDIEYIDRKLLKYKGNLMSYEELEKEYHKIKHTL